MYVILQLQHSVGDVSNSTSSTVQSLTELVLFFYFSLQNAIYFIMLHCLVPVLFAVYLQGVLKFKCKIPTPKG